MTTQKVIANTLVFFTIILIGYLIYIGQNIVVPFAFSLLLSITLLPVYRFFKKFRLGEVMAIMLTILFAFVIILIIITILSIEFSSLLENKDELQNNINSHLKKISFWIQENMNYSIAKQSKFVNNQLQQFQLGATVLSTTASSITTMLVWFGVVPVYVFLILFYKNLLIRFVFLCTKRNQHDTVEEFIYDTETTIKSYLGGLMIEMFIVAILLWLGLIIFGVKYALLIAATFAILNIVPYVGSLIATVIITLVTLATSPLISHTFIAIAIMVVVQIIDNNIIMNYLVSSKVKINALVTVIAVIIGQSLAGVGGMFLAIPTVAVIKLFFDKIPNLKHWAQLLGEDNPKFNALNHRALRLKKKPVQTEQNCTNESDNTTK